MQSLHVYTNKFTITVLLLIVAMTPACSKFLDADPPTDSIIADNVFKNDANALAAVSGIYTEMMISNTGQLSNGFISVYGGLCADEIYGFKPADLEFSNNQVTAVDYSITYNMWKGGYTYLYRINAVLEGLNKSSGLSEAVGRQLKGEALFLKGLVYAQLTNLYGKIVLTNSTAYQVNNSLPRSETAVVYDSIVSCLKAAESLLTAKYPSDGRVRPNRFAATALLARVYLYKGSWQEAATKAGEVIAGPYSLVKDLSKVFLKGSDEAIWQLMPVNAAGRNTIEGNQFIPDTSSLVAPKYALTDGLSAAFEPQDKRRGNWTGNKLYNNKTYLYPAKYKVMTGTNTNPANATEYTIVLRLAEQYLIRAEANAQLGNTVAAIADLDSIRSRAGLPYLSGVTGQAAVLKAVAQERRIELFAEWGHRWFDLIRTRQADAVLAPLKPTWKPTAVLWPLPQYELNVNTALKQNDGYNN